MTQLRMALLTDFTGIGRCSATVDIPILASLKIESCLAPTAILSAHTGFSTYYMQDFSPYFSSYVKAWQENHETFSGIMTGFMGSATQIDLAYDFIQAFPTSFVMVDPVMGDNGKLYDTYNSVMCKKMRSLVSLSTIITPNVTEACVLAAYPYDPFIASNKEKMNKLITCLAKLGPNNIVITGIEKGNAIGNCIYQKGKPLQWVWRTKENASRSGTGDVFSAVLGGMLLRGMTIEKAVGKAADFVATALCATDKLGIHSNYGLAIEEVLETLW